VHSLEYILAFSAVRTSNPDNAVEVDAKMDGMLCGSYLKNKPVSGSGASESFLAGHQPLLSSA
jgi:hypothetical protein